MSTKPYTPLPGTVASKAIAWLMDQPFGISYSCAVIADATDTDANGMIPNLSTAVAHGLLIKDKIDGLVCYRIGDGQPPAPIDAPPDDGVLVPVQIWTPAATAPATPAPSASAKPATPRKTKRADLDASNHPLHNQVQALQAAASAAPASTGFFVGATMGGDIQIHKGGVMLTLDDQEFAFAIRMAAALYPNTYPGVTP